MRTAYIWAIGGLLVIIGMTLYPTLKYILSFINVSGMPPIESTVVTIGLPLFFLFFIGYLINRLRG